MNRIGCKSFTNSVQRLRVGVVLKDSVDGADDEIAVLIDAESVRSSIVSDMDRSHHRKQAVRRFFPAEHLSEAVNVEFIVPEVWNGSHQAWAHTVINH
ncbi:MAG: hypothetical protein BWY82_02031 [Verrucomicrobia bacterium ADurb.Bin474]|nr:MAG: hypothetical protein BWY82_02031 [Verrucomicrobia bacterium ADurb.Bin474]